MKNVITILILLSTYSAWSFEIVNSNKTITKQEGLFWCWAATLEAIQKYENKKITQKEIILKNSNFVEFDLEVYKNHPIFLINPDYYISILKKYNFKIIKKDKIESFLLKNKPVIHLANNHASVIVGFDKDHYKVMDTSIGQIIQKNKNELSKLRTNNASFDIDQQNNEAIFLVSKK